MSTTFIIISLALFAWFMTHVLLAFAMVKSGNYKHVSVDALPLWISALFAVLGVVTR